jgi:membrane-associated phospholipid phosphatase
MEAAGRARRRWGWWIAVVVFCALAALSVYLLDARVAAWVHERGIDAWAKKYVWVRRKLKFLWPGHFACTVVIATLVAWLHRSGLRGALVVLVAAVITGLNSVIKWGVGRPRPSWKSGEASFVVDPFKGGFRGLFTQENLAFPSGDAALAVSTAAVLGYLLPRGWPVWWLMAVVVAAQRVAENAHHLSDVLAAGALGVVAFHCARLAGRVSTDEPRAPLAQGPDRVG